MTKEEKQKIKRRIWKRAVQERIRPLVRDAFYFSYNFRYGRQTFGEWECSQFNKAVKSIKKLSEEEVKNLQVILNNLTDRYFQRIVSWDTGEELEMGWGPFERAVSRQVNKANELLLQTHSFLEACLNTPYFPEKDLPEIMKKLYFLLDHRPPIDGRKLGQILTAQKVSSLEEAVECSNVSIERHQVLAKLGEGTYKKAYLAENEELPGLTYALLVTDVAHLKEKAQHYLQKLGRTALENCRSEAQKLAQFNFLRNPHLPLIVAPPVYDEKKGIYYWVEEYVEKKLLETVGEVPIYYKNVMDVMAQLAKAVIPVHKLGYFHGDLNFDNLGFSEREVTWDALKGHIKILDWGLCSSIPSNPQDNQGREFLGYRLSRAPEVYRGELPTEKSDIWSIGIMGYKLLTGKYPFTWSFTGTKEEWHVLPMNEKSRYEEEVKDQVLSFSVNDLQTKIDQDTSFIRVPIGYRLDYDPRTTLRSLMSAIVHCLTPDPLQRISSVDLYQKVEGLSHSDSAYILDGP